MTIQSGKGISMNGEPMEGTATTMNEDGLPVAQGTPLTTGGGGITMNNVTNTPTTTTTTTTTMGGTPIPSIPMHEQEKIGSKCCGACCDFRRAVIIVDILWMILSAMSLLSIVLGPVVGDIYRAQGIDDDEVIDVVEDSTLVNNIISGVGFLCMAVPLWGATKYSIPLIGFGIVWLIAQFIAGVIVSVIYTQKANDVSSETIGMPFFNWILSAIGTALIIYPHAGLMAEINKGIMSPETYPREEYSCCCTGGR